MSSQVRQAAISALPAPGLQIAETDLVIRRPNLHFIAQDNSRSLANYSGTNEVVGADR
jgi:hypothetical protein